MHSFPITRNQFNYMLPVTGFRRRMLARDLPNGDQQFYFFGSHEDHRDFLNRCRYL